VISVVIPVLNESSTIGRLVEFALSFPGVEEVIVVDDGSIDETPELARAAGANVITSTFMGKGASMEDGLRASRGELVVYLDGDMVDLRPGLITKLVEPLVTDRADFVKAGFARRAGRVTTLTARPLLSLFFPEIAALRQPLGGIIAARRRLLQNLRYEPDYGVDLGLVLDASAREARIEEVDIGRIDHESNSLEVLGDMAKAVVRVILDRAWRYDRLNISQVREVEEVERRAEAELALSLSRLGLADRLALLDMDGILLDGRYITRLAEATDRREEVARYLDNPALSAEVRTQSLPALFSGEYQDTFIEVAREIPLMEGAVETVVGLRKAGYRVGIVTDSYQIAAETVQRRVFADFSVAHLMRFRRGRATGEITFSPAMVREGGCRLHERCKLNVMLNLCEKTGLDPSRVLAVGDGENDACLLEAAGNSVAFRPRSPELETVAKHTVQGSLAEILNLIE
jgi:phosphoserine phosphatase